jgi:hypothetical protein
LTIAGVLSAEFEGRILPQLAARFGLSRLLTRYSLDQANLALAEMAGRAVIKAVLVMAALRESPKDE